MKSTEPATTSLLALLIFGQKKQNLTDFTKVSKPPVNVKKIKYY
jgi:hypothetical protein